MEGAIEIARAEEARNELAELAQCIACGATVTFRQSKNYTLFFGDLKIGIVTHEDADFPNLFGRIAIEPALTQSATLDAQAYGIS